MFTSSIGTRVEATELSAQHREAFTILGAWDSDPERGIISYLSPMAQALLNHKPGEEVELEMEGGVRKRYRIEGIEALKTATPVISNSNSVISNQ